MKRVFILENKNLEAFVADPIEGEGIILVSTVDIETLSKRGVNLNPYEIVLCSSKYQKISRENWEEMLKKYYHSNDS